MWAGYGGSPVAWVLTALLFAFPLGSGWAQAPTAHGAAKAAEVVMLSDLHFDPFHDPAKIARLNAAGADTWAAILAQPDSPTMAADTAKLNAACPMRGIDAAWPLVRSSLLAARAAAPRAAFVTVSGDLLAHEFDCRFHHLLPAASGEDYSRFAARAVTFLALQLRATFGVTPVFAALGNNDSGCGDYRESTDSRFLKAISASLAGASDAGEHGAAAQAQFTEDGSYSVALPAPFERGRLLVVQDMFLSRLYKTCDGKPDPVAAAKVLQWLHTQLDHARAQGEQVWVMAHIPPGVDVYSTVVAHRDVCAGQEPVLFLSGNGLTDTITRFAGTVRLAIFGHTHNDEMYLLRPDEDLAGASPVPAKLVPSISPINGNLPAFTVAEVDPRTVTLEDYRVVMASNASGADETWKEEYRFSDVYGGTGYTAAHVAGLLNKLTEDRTGMNKMSTDYAQYFFPGGGRGTLAAHLFWQQYSCVTDAFTPSQYRACVCPAARAGAPQ